MIPALLGENTWPEITTHLKKMSRDGRLVKIPLDCLSSELIVETSEDIDGDYFDHPVDTITEDVSINEEDAEALIFVLIGDFTEQSCDYVTIPIDQAAYLITQNLDSYNAVLKTYMKNLMRESSGSDVELMEKEFNTLSTEQKLQLYKASLSYARKRQNRVGLKTFNKLMKSLK